MTKVKQGGKKLNAKDGRYGLKKCITMIFMFYHGNNKL